MKCAPRSNGMPKVLVSVTQRPPTEFAASSTATRRLAATRRRPPAAPPPPRRPRTARRVPPPHRPPRRRGARPRRRREGRSRRGGGGGGKERTAAHAFHGIGVVSGRARFSMLRGDARKVFRGGWSHGSSVPIPKFASPCGTLSCELRNQRDTSN